MKPTKRKPRGRRQADRSRGTQKQLNKTLFRAVLDLQKRMEKLERRERVITGFTCAESSHEAAPYRDLEEIAEEAELG